MTVVRWKWLYRKQGVAVWAVRIDGMPIRELDICKHVLSQASIFVAIKYAINLAFNLASFDHGFVRRF